ncbi:VWA domain-containing protein [Dongshaea marina]|uniref:VWA domain-containing protein n=1 Tax=Dongshaea marina TaxID=2047966 RepID=UPI000D3E4F97|nr:VWA domain-containing protein [Dongshaea marina]
MSVDRQQRLASGAQSLQQRLEAESQELQQDPRVSQFLNEHNSHRQALSSELTRWHQKVSQQILEVQLPDALEYEIRLFTQCQSWSGAQLLEGLIRSLESCDSAFLEDARLLLTQLKGVELEMEQRLLLRRWQQHLELCIITEQLAAIDKARAQILEELYRKMNAQEELSSVMGKSDPKKSQRLWNMVGAKLERQQYQRLKQMAELLEHYPKLMEIAEELGRQAANSTSVNDLSAQHPELRPVLQQMQSLPEELGGICLSDELARLILSETLFLSDPDLEVIFYKHLLEKRLLNYQFRGKNTELDEVMISHAKSRDELQPKGPFIVCVDTSGSMSGFAELCAKALCFALMRIALSDERECQVLLFSTDVLEYQLTARRGLNHALDFLGYSYKGGTDLAPAIRHAIEKMAEQKFENADLVVISDFIAPKLPDDLLKELNKLRKNQNRFNAITLSQYGNPALTELFDSSWHFNPTLYQRLKGRSH